MEEFGAPLPDICDHINTHFDVEGLCKGLPHRLQKVIDAGALWPKQLLLSLDYHWPVVIQTQVIISEVPHPSKILERLAQRPEGTPQVTI